MFIKRSSHRRIAVLTVFSCYTVIQECYGSQDIEKTHRVKQLYNDLDLPNTYAIYEEETYNLLKTQMQQIRRDLPRNLFLKTIEDIYSREFKV